jgi:hypothetical protein
VEELKAKAPASLSVREKANWASEQRAKQITFAVDALQDRLRVGAMLEPQLINGELRLLDEGTAVLEGVFVDPDEAQHVLVHWRDVLRTSTPIRPNAKAADLARELRQPPIPPTPTIATQIAQLDSRLSDLDKEIAATEMELDALACRLYELSVPEIQLIEADSVRVNGTAQPH